MSLQLYFFIADPSATGPLSPQATCVMGTDELGRSNDELEQLMTKACQERNLVLRMIKFVPLNEGMEEAFRRAHSTGWSTWYTECVAAFRDEFSRPVEGGPDELTEDMITLVEQGFRQLKNKDDRAFFVWCAGTAGRFTRLSLEGKR